MTLHLNQAASSAWVQNLQIPSNSKEASWVKLVAQNPPANAGDIGDVLRSLGRAETLEEERATRSSILAWKNPTDREALWATVCGATKSRTQLKRLSTLRQ